MLGVPGALGQASNTAGSPVREPKPSDCLNEEKSIRPPRTPNNAAWVYFELWDSVPKDRYDALSSFGNVPFLSNDPVRLAPAQRELWLKSQTYIEGLIRAAAMNECDWGVQHQHGEEFRLPHLRHVRDSYRALHIDVYRCMEDRSALAAAARLAAMVQMSDQTRTDCTLISSLVGASMFLGSTEQVRSLVKEPWCTPAAARMILTACQRIQQDDLFGFVSAMDGERWHLTQWPRQRFRGPLAGAEYYPVMDDSRGWPFIQYPSLFFIAMGEQQLFADLDRFDAYLAKTLPLWKDPANDLRLRELEVEALEGQFGLAASCQAEHIELSRRALNRARSQVQQMVKELELYIRTSESSSR